MKQFTVVILLLLISSFSVSAQSEELETLVKEGVEQHDKGEYKKAIETFEKALKIDKKSPLVNYEMANTYLALKKYKDAIKHANTVIKVNKKYVGSAFILKGTAQDLQGKSKDAIKTYKKGIKKDPSNYLLHFNLALTAFNSKDYKTAEESALNAIKNKPTHASSHILLSYAANAQNKRVQTVLASFYFIMLEPNTKRSTGALQLLEARLNQGVKKTGENEISISISSDTDDEFSAAELSLSMLAATKSIEENEKKTEQQLFVENTESFFKILGELNDKKKKSFWWTYYVKFFYDMTQAGHNEAFCYYVMLSKKDKEVMEWLSENEEKISAFSKWFETYDFKTK